MQKGQKRCRLSSPGAGLLLPFLFSSCAPLGIFPAGHLISSGMMTSRWPTVREKGAYEVRVVANKKLLWEVEWETIVNKEKGKSWVQVHESGYGQPWHCPEPITWEKEMVFDIAPELQFDSVEGTRWTSQGKLLSHLDIHTDPKRQFILYTDTDKGDKREHRIPWTNHTFPDELLFHWVRALNFDQNLAGEYLLLVGPTRRFRMQAFVRGTEKVTTPAGTFSCYRIELIFRLGALELLPLKSLLVPRLTLWCTIDPPHFWVRYQGPVGGPGSPQVMINLTRFEQGSVR